MNRDYFSTGQVAQMLGLRPYQVHYLLDTGRIREPQLRVAGKRIWTAAEIEAARESLDDRLDADNGISHRGCTT